MTQIKSMFKSIKKKGNENAAKLWTFYSDVRGGALIENKILMILAIVVIFGIGSRLIPWLQDYFTGVTTDIQNNGGVNNNFGNSVNW